MAMLDAQTIARGFARDADAPAGHESDVRCFRPPHVEAGGLGKWPKTGRYCKVRSGAVVYRNGGALALRRFPSEHWLQVAKLKTDHDHTNLAWALAQMGKKTPQELGFGFGGGGGGGGDAAAECAAAGARVEHKRTYFVTSDCCSMWHAVAGDVYALETAMHALGVPPAATADELRERRASCRIIVVKKLSAEYAIKMRGHAVMDILRWYCDDVQLLQDMAAGEAKECYADAVLPVSPAGSPLWAGFWKGEKKNRLASCGRSSVAEGLARRAWLAALGQPQAPHAPQPPTILLLQRTDKKRKLGDEEAAMAAMRRVADRYGFRVRAVDMSKMPLPDQVRAAGEASVLVGVHGAALVHALWARPGAAVLELRPKQTRGKGSALPVEAYRSVAQLRGLGYFTITGTKPRVGKGAGSVAVSGVEVHYPLQLNVSELEEALVRAVKHTRTHPTPFQVPHA